MRVEEWVRSWRVGRAWMTNVALCLIGCGLVMLARQFVVENDHFVMGFSGVSGWSAWLYVAAVILILTQPVDRSTLWIVLGFAVAMRAMTVFAEPFLSSDIYRYVWDGVVQHAHVNPYRYVPGDAALTYLRAPNQDIFDNINRRDYARTIYPPVAQMVYWGVTFFSPTVMAMKAAMVGFECVTAGALVWLLRAMGRPQAEVLLYAWCPLLVWEVGGSGHVDAVVMAFTMLAVVARYREKPVWTGLFLGLAVMTKFYPLVLLPAFWMRRKGKLGEWKLPAAMLAVGVVGYSVYLSVGKLVVGFLFHYATEEGIDSGVRFFFLDMVQRVRGLSGTPVWAYMIFCAVVMGGIAWWGWKVAAVVGAGDGIVRAHSSRMLRAMNGAPDGVGVPAFMKAGMMLSLAMMLLFSPHYPWYVLWLIPFFVLVPSLPVLVYLMMFFYMFTTALADGTAGKMYVVNECLYGATGVAVVVAAVMKRWAVWRWANPRTQARG